MSIVVAKFANSFSEPACQQANNLPLVFSSTPWTLYSLLRRARTEVYYRELPVRDDLSHGPLTELSDLLGTGSVLVLCGGISGRDMHTVNQRAACQVAKRAGARVIVLGTFHGYENEFRDWSGCDTVVTALDRVEAVRSLLDAGVLDRSDRQLPALMSNRDVKPTKQFHPTADFLEVEEEIRTKSYWSHPYSYKQRIIGAGTGCPFGCAFCRLQRTPWTVPSPESLARNFAFFDGTAVDTVVSDMFLDRRWVKSFLEHLGAQGANLWLRTLSRADSLERCLDLLPMVRDVGFRVISIGFESANARVLRSIDKINNEVWRYEKIVNAAERHGIFIHMNVLIGLPEDDHDSLRETYEIVRSMGHSMTMSTFRPQKDTSIYQQVVEAGIPNPHANDFESYRKTHRAGQKEVFLPTKYLSTQEVQEWYEQISALRSPKADSVYSKQAIRDHLEKRTSRPNKASRIRGWLRSLLADETNESQAGAH